MSMEADLTALLKTRCPRVFTDFAPVNTPRPYVTYQHIGGTPLRFVDGNAAAIRHTLVQINTWGDRRSDVLALARQIEDDICTSATWSARPESEPVGDAEEDISRYGTRQDFSIWAAR